MHIKYMMR